MYGVRGKMAEGEERVLTCPECGEVLGYRDEIFTRETQDTVVGCSNCLRSHNAQEWVWERERVLDWMDEEWAAMWEEL